MRRLLALAEGRFSPLKSKTANGAIIYLPNQVVAVVDSTKVGKTAQDVLGYGGNIPVVGSIDEGLKFQPTDLLIGIAPSGGRLPEEWRGWIKTALRNKLNILSGLHTILSDDGEFTQIAKEHGVSIIDWRKVPHEYEVVSKGNYRTRKAKTILTVGADCNIGKMTTMLEVYKNFQERGLKSDFIGTGQTGIMISGKGIAVDAVISDYIAGSIEKCIDASNDEGYGYIFVEGQGALTHQGYSGVTYGLMHGTMPDAMIMCVQPTRLVDDYTLPIPDLNRLIKLHEEAINIFRPTKVVGIGINSIGLTDGQSRDEAKKLEDKTGLPAVDAFRFGGEKLADALVRYLT
ncbi:MAG: DUF1611 domain-containing protein [Bacteroidota bacterium]|jgi:uncharacterized NAD-dependent epimerase/dehydratase family protein